MTELRGRIARNADEVRDVCVFDESETEVVEKTIRAYLQTSVFTCAGSICALGRLHGPSTPVDPEHPASDQLQPSVSSIDHSLNCPYKY